MMDELDIMAHYNIPIIKEKQTPEQKAFILKVLSSNTRPVDIGSATR